MITTYEKDDTVISIPVTFEAGSEITSLTGGSVEAVAKRNSTTVSPASASIVDASTIIVRFSDNTLSVGTYKFQVRATVSGVTLTVLDDEIFVQASL